MDVSRHLLLGLLALQGGFITKEQLVAAFSSWTSDKQRPLEEWLLANRALSESQVELIKALVAEHLRQNDNDPQRSLSALPSPPPVRESLEALADSELTATLVYFPKDSGSSGDTPRRIPFSTSPAPSQIVSSSRFRILRPHAAGGLGQISVALDEELKREVAFKEIRPEFAHQEQSRQRFIREAEITGALEHPSIVPIYGLGSYADGRPYYAMRFIKGDSLRDWITMFHCEKSQMSPGERVLSLRQLLARFVDVCQAMHYAHSRGVLHRDIKPHNVMLGKYGETLVVDWGLAKTIGEKSKEFSAEMSAPLSSRLSGSTQMTAHGSAVGTPAYMSPEQADGRTDDLGPTTDVYSLGVTLYHCLTGKAPFPQKSEADVLAAVRKGEYLKPREVDATIPRSLEAICLKAMQIAPKDRYASAQDLANDVERFLADEPVSAHSESASERLTRFGRRHRAAAQTALLGLALITLLLSAGIFVVVRQREAARKLASENQTLATDKSRLAEESNQRAANQAALAQERGELLRKNEIQGAAIRRESARHAFAYGLSIFDSPARSEAIAQLLRAQTLSSDDPQLKEAYRLVMLDRLSIGGRNVNPPCWHPYSVQSVVFSPDGTRFVSTSYDFTARLWDATTGAPIGEPMKHPGEIRFVKFSEEDNRLLTGCADELLSFSKGGPSPAPREKVERYLFTWDALTSEPRGEPMKISSALGPFVFSPSGQQVLVGFDKTVQILDLKTGMQVGGPLEQDRTVGDLTLSQDGQRLAVVCDDNTLRIWKLGAETRLERKIPHVRRGCSPTFSADGKRLLTTSSDDIAEVWDCETGAAIGKPMMHAIAIYHVAFSADGERIATASADNTVRIWNTQTGEMLFDPLVHPEDVTEARFSPDQRVVATCCMDQVIRFWDAETGVFLSAPIRHSGFISGFDFSPDSTRLTSSSSDQTVRTTFTLSRAPQLTQLPRGLSNEPLGVSADGRFFVVRDEGQSLQVFDRQSGAKIGERATTIERLNCAALRPDGAAIAVGSSAEVSIWLIGESKYDTRKFTHKGLVNFVNYSPDGKLLAAASREHGVRIWEVQSGALKVEFPEILKTESCPVISPDQKFVAITREPDVLQLYDLSLGKAFGTPLRHSGGYFCKVAFSPDSKLLATSIENSGRIWDVESQASVGELMQHADWIYHFEFSRDGKMLATASGDKTARLWNVFTGKHLLASCSHPLRVTHVRFGRDEQALETLCPDGTSRIWDISTTPLPMDHAAWLDLQSGTVETKDRVFEPLSETRRAEHWKSLLSDESWKGAFLNHGRLQNLAAIRSALNRAELDDHVFAVHFYLQQLKLRGVDEPKLDDRIAAANARLPRWRLFHAARRAEQIRDWPNATARLDELKQFYPGDAALESRSTHAREQLAKAPTAGGSLFKDRWGDNQFAPAPAIPSSPQR